MPKRKGENGFTPVPRAMSLSPLKKAMHIPGLNFGERQALRHYAKEAGMSPEEMVRECITEMAYQIAMIARWDRMDCGQKIGKDGGQ